MRKILVMLIFLTLASAFVNISLVSTTATEDLLITPGLPENIPREPMPENFTTDDYSNTTNPYADAISPFDELNETEGDHPLYVLVFADEEECECQRLNTTLGPLFYWEWAQFQIERGDESLVADYGIDIRILDILCWFSNDSLDTMEDLWYELEEDTKQYLHQWYEGPYWSNYVDAIIGITAQSTTDNAAGKSPSAAYLDQGRIFVLLKWQVYWTDDNLVQHEVSHLYYAPDHTNPCCAMASHTHFQTWILEDGIYWWVFADVRCAYTSYSWCANCHSVIQENSGRYPIRTLTISEPQPSFGGTTDPAPGPYAHSYGSSTTVTATAFSGYYFYYWLLDETIVYSNPINVTMDSDYTLTACFAQPAMKTRTNGSFYIPNVTRDFLKIELLFDESGIEGDQTGGTSPYSAIAHWPDKVVDGNDIIWISRKSGLEEGESGWEYMMDVWISPPSNRTIDGNDLILAARNFGNWISEYDDDLTGVTVTFNTSEEITPDDGYVEIPQDATSFTVYKNDETIGVLIIFW